MDFRGLGWGEITKCKKSLSEVMEGFPQGLALKGQAG